MQMPEIGALVVGSVMTVTPLTKFGTTEPDGIRVALLAGDGASQVKVPQNLVHLVGSLGTGEQVAWIVRFGNWNIDGRSGLMCTFQGLADRVHLDAAAVVIDSKVPAGK